jgi:hypothetical protein
VEVANPPPEFVLEEGSRGEEERPLSQSPLRALGYAREQKARVPGGVSEGLGCRSLAEGVGK